MAWVIQTLPLDASFLNFPCPSLLQRDVPAPTSNLNMPRQAPLGGSVWPPFSARSGAVSGGAGASAPPSPEPPPARDGRWAPLSSGQGLTRDLTRCLGRKEGRQEPLFLFRSRLSHRLPGGRSRGVSPSPRCLSGGSSGGTG